MSRKKSRYSTRESLNKSSIMLGKAFLNDLNTSYTESLYDAQHYYFKRNNFDDYIGENIDLNRIIKDCKED